MRVLFLTVIALIFTTTVNAQDADPRIFENPTLAEMFEQDPRRAENLLLKLDEILIGPEIGLDRSQNKVPPSIAQLIEQNPLFDLSYRQDAKRTLKLIEAVLGEK